MPVIRISDSLYKRLEKLAVGFDTPANIMERILNEHEGVKIVEKELLHNQNRITQDVIERVYLYSEEVYKQKMSIADAQEALVKELNMHSGSARDYINNFQKMMCGDCYQRTMNGAATDYYLKNIYSIFGKERLEIALSSVKQHIKYYEQFSNGKLLNIRQLVSKYYKLLRSDG